MITEEQFTTAMRAAVAERGGDWCYPKHKDVKDEGGWYHFGIPTYSNLSGEATCLIGKAMELAGMKVPYLSSGSAYSVLFGEAPMLVAVAARTAQTHQDHSRPWGEALALYEWVVANYVVGTGVVGSVYQDACTALGIEPAYSDAVGKSMTVTFSMSNTFEQMTAQVVETAKEMQAAMKAMDEAVIEANKTVTDKVPYFPVNQIANPMPIVGLAKGGIVTNTFATGGVIYQKDHALIA